MLERLKQLFAPKPRGPEVGTEAERPMGEGPASLPVGPTTSGVPPAAPVGELRDEPDDALP